MTRLKQAPTPPPELVVEDPHKFLASFKASLAKRWSLTRMNELYEVVELLGFLHALDRDEEALALAKAVAAAIPAPPPMPGGGVNYNVWCAATQVHAFVAHLVPADGQAEASRQALLADCGILRGSGDYIANRAAKAAREGAKEPAAKPSKAAKQNGARHLADAMLFAVLAEAGDPCFVPHGDASRNALAPLRSRLRRMLG